MMKNKNNAKKKKKRECSRSPKAVRVFQIKWEQRAAVNVQKLLSALHLEKVNLKKTHETFSPSKEKVKFAQCCLVALIITWTK